MEAKTDLKQIKEIETYVGLTFPKEYVEHLLEYNGGQCSPSIFQFYEKGKCTTSCIDWFLAIYNGKYDNLKNHIQIFKIDDKRMPTHMVPIANDPGGNLICISCDEEEEGYIYFWDHENEVDYLVSNDRDYSNLFFVAKSFGDFLNGLKEDIE